MLKAWPFMTLRIVSVTYENWGNKTDIKKTKKFYNNDCYNKNLN